jgi:Domain of unknown function (DUF389)
MVVGPEFGPVGGLCVALVERRGELAARSALALAVGFPLAIGVTVLATLAFDAGDLIPAGFDSGSHGLSEIIANPGVFAFIIAAFA